MHRRKFLSTAAATSTLLLLKSKTAFGYQANSAVRIGLLGCGNRGTAVASAFVKSTNARLVALADILPSQIAAGKTRFNSLNASLNKPAIEDRLTFHGPEAFQQLANSKDIDAVQISTPPFFHVQHLEAAVDAGKHVYCEKPVGVDIAQAAKALEISSRIKGRLSVDIGFEVRNAPPIAAILDQIHAGALGKIAAATGVYFAPASTEKPTPGASADAWRLRNWLWFRNLSGDILVEQNIHIIDLCNLALNAHPIKAYATGGRSILSNPGDIWDNYQVDFTYPGGIHLSFASTQFGSGAFSAGLTLFGENGAAEAPYAGPVRITGKTHWDYSTASGQAATSTNATFAANGAFSNNLEFADRDKTRSFIDSITSGNFHNQIPDGVDSARSCMLGRMAAYTGQETTWAQLLAHGETYTLGLDLNKI